MASTSRPLLPLPARTAAAEQSLGHSSRRQWTPSVTAGHRHSCPSGGRSCWFASPVLPHHPASSSWCPASCRSPVTSVTSNWISPLIRSRPWRYINLLTYLLTYQNPINFCLIISRNRADCLEVYKMKSVFFFCYTIRHVFWNRESAKNSWKIVKQKINLYLRKQLLSVLSTAETSWISQISIVKLKMDWRINWKRLGNKR